MSESRTFVYRGGKGVILAKPLATHPLEIEGGKPFTVTSRADVRRLLNDPRFEALDEPKVAAPAPAPEPAVAESPVADVDDDPAVVASVKKRARFTPASDE